MPIYPRIAQSFNSHNNVIMFIHFLIYTYILLLFYPLCVYPAKVRKVHVSYPVELLPPIVSEHFEGYVSQNKLTCFSNRDFKPPTYLNTLSCMLTAYFDSNNNIRCNSIWGSRSVVVEVNGSVEFLKLAKLPRESNLYTDTNDLHTTRWLELNSFVSSSASYLDSLKDIKLVPCEPVYLCARSNDWNGRDSSFNIHFRPGYIRLKDKDLIFSKCLMHLSLVFFVSSVWLLPYIAAFIVGTVTYKYAITYLVLFALFSLLVVCLTPFMLTKRNRHFARHYIKYFFTRIHAEETREIIKKRIIVFQAVYFSSVMVCIGLAGSQILYSYCGVDRNMKNVLIKICVGMAASWLTFSLCRSFERFCRDWSWIVLCIGLAQLLDKHLNPAARDEVFVVILLVSFITKASLNRLLKNYDWIKIAWFPYSQLRILSSSRSLMTKLHQALKSRKLPILRDIISVSTVNELFVSSTANLGSTHSTTSIHSNRSSFSVKNDEAAHMMVKSQSKNSISHSSLDDVSKMYVPMQSDVIADEVILGSVHAEKDQEVDVGYSIDEFNGLTTQFDEIDEAPAADVDEVDSESDDDIMEEEGGEEDQGLDESITIEQFLDDVINPRDHRAEGAVASISADDKLYEAAGFSSDKDAVSQHYLQTKIPFQPSSSFTISQAAVSRIPTIMIDGKLIKDTPYFSACPMMDQILRRALLHYNRFNLSIESPPMKQISANLELKFESFLTCKRYHEHLRTSFDRIKVLIEETIAGSNMLTSYRTMLFASRDKLIVSILIDETLHPSISIALLHRTLRQSLNNVYKYLLIDANASDMDSDRNVWSSYDIHLSPAASESMANVVVEHCLSEQQTRQIFSSYHDMSATDILPHLQQKLQSMVTVAQIAPMIVIGLLFPLGFRLQCFPCLLNIDVAVTADTSSSSTLATKNESHQPDDRGPSSSNPLELNFLDDAEAKSMSDDDSSFTVNHSDPHFVWQLRMNKIDAEYDDNGYHPSLASFDDDPLIFGKLVASLLLAYSIEECLKNDIASA
jgi:hypothetical protein